jgi:hypothetical protein
MKVILLWKMAWLSQTFQLARTLRHQDEAAQRVFSVCQSAIIGVPGHANASAAQAMLGYSYRSVRRQTKQQFKSYWGHYPLEALIADWRARLRTTLYPVALHQVKWWEYVPLFIEHEAIPLWMEWHTWDRLALPDLSEWCQRFQSAPPVSGRDLLELEVEGLEASVSTSDLVKFWSAAPVAVRTLENETGHFVSMLFDGADVARLEWNRWVLYEN